GCETLAPGEQAAEREVALEPCQAADVVAILVSEEDEIERAHAPHPQEGRDDGAASIEAFARVAHVHRPGRAVAKLEHLGVALTHVEEPIAKIDGSLGREREERAGAEPEPEAGAGDRSPLRPGSRHAPEDPGQSGC